MVFANYYRRFIKGYSQVAAPLHSFTSSKCPSDWPPAVALVFFPELQSLFTTAPILTMPDPNRQFIMKWMPQNVAWVPPLKGQRKIKSKYVSLKRPTQFSRICRSLSAMASISKEFFPKPWYPITAADSTSLLSGCWKTFLKSVECFKETYLDFFFNILYLAYLFKKMGKIGISCCILFTI